MNTTRVLCYFAALCAAAVLAYTAADRAAHRCGPAIELEEVE